MWQKSDYDALKETGLSAADIKKALDDRKALEDKLKAQETELNTAKQTLQTMEGSFNEVKTKLSELEASSKTRQTPTQQTTENQRTSFLDNEDAAFNERFTAGVQPLAAATILAGKNSARLEAKMSLMGQTIKTSGGVIPLDKLWVRWLPEIEKAASEVRPEANLMLAATWINIFDYIKGKHFSEILEKPDSFVESVQTNTQTSVTERQAEDNKLSDEELSIVNKMKSETGGRVTPEKYAETRKKIKFVNV